MKFLKIAVFASTLMLVATACYFFQPPVLITAYGDSTQETHGNPHAAQRKGMIIENRGKSGTSTADLLVDWEREMQASKAKIIVINHGINDRPGTVDAYRSNLRELVSIAQKAGKVVVLEEPNPAGEVATQFMRDIKFDVPAFEARRRAMRELAKDMGVHFCPQPSVPLADGIHPNLEGDAIKAKRLGKCLYYVAIRPWSWMLP